VRVGIGYDVHPFTDGRRLVLGGVEVEHDRGLGGHSDADVLAHAIIDALLGAGGMGDIGELFPDTEQLYRDADSLELLQTVVGRLANAGLRVANVDATVVMEAPRLAPHRQAIRARLAAALRVAPESVGVKATTGEGLGFVGRREGVAAIAVALLTSEG